MYNPPILKDGTKIYKIRSAYKRRIVAISLIMTIGVDLPIVGISIIDKSPVDNMYVWFLAIFVTVFSSWVVYQAFLFRLVLTNRGGTLYGLNKVVEFDWQDAAAIGYTYRKEDNKAELSLYLTQSNTKKGLHVASKYYFPIQVKNNAIPLDALYHQKSFWSLNIKPKPPTQDEYSIHLRYFLHTPMGQDIIKYAPHVLGDVLHKYVPDNDLDY